MNTTLCGECTRAARARGGNVVCVCVCVRPCPRRAKVGEHAETGAETEQTLLGALVRGKGVPLVPVVSVVRSSSRVVACRRSCLFFGGFSCRERAL